MNSEEVKQCIIDETALKLLSDKFIALGKAWLELIPRPYIQTVEDDEPLVYVNKLVSVDLNGSNCLYCGEFSALTGKMHGYGVLFCK